MIIEIPRVPSVVGKMSVCMYAELDTRPFAYLKNFYLKKLARFYW